MEIELAAQAAQAVQAVLVARGAVGLDAVAQAIAQAASTMLAAVGLAVEAGASLSGAVIDFGIVTPDERTWHVVLELRTLAVGAEDRAVQIVHEDRSVTA
jgi:hypothetical protein